MVQLHGKKWRKQHVSYVGANVVSHHHGGHRLWHRLHSANLTVLPLLLAATLPTPGLVGFGCCIAGHAAINDSVCAHATDQGVIIAAVLAANSNGC